MKFSTLDLFCHVIDNYGDAGVALRFCRAFRLKHPDCTVRLFIDEMKALLEITTGLDAVCPSQDLDGITIINLQSLPAAEKSSIEPAEIIIEAFACHLPEWYLDKAYFRHCLIINLDYLSAESWTAGYHLKESLLPCGSAKKYFYMPGFTSTTGGILPNTRFTDDVVLRGAFPAAVAEQLLKTGCRHNYQSFASIGTLFTYEKSFDALLNQLDTTFASSLLLCFGNKTHTGIYNTLKRLGQPQRADQSFFTYGRVSIALLPFFEQRTFDQLLYTTDYNIVRGEDSLTRAILAGRPFLWNAYLQDDKYQLVKVEALCSMISSYFETCDTFAAFKQIMFEFNDQQFDGSNEPSNENFNLFFENLKNFEHATLKLCYFMEHQCNLIEKISEFINAFDFT